MLELLPQSIRDELHLAQNKTAQRRNRLRVEAGGESYRIVRMTDEGFALDAADAPKLRGLADLLDGSRHLSQCLIVAANEEDGEMVYDFKRNTTAYDGAPLDFERAVDAPIALLGR